MNRLTTRADADASLDPDRIVLLGEAGRDRDAFPRSGTRTAPATGRVNRPDFDGDSGTP
jgi:hypothetical protein